MSNARFSIIQARAVRDTRISNAQFRTLAALGMYADTDSGWCFPALNTLSSDLGEKDKAAVSRDIKALAEFGYVEIEPQFRANGSQTSNRYRVIYDLPEPTPIDTTSTPPLTPRQSPIDDSTPPPLTSEVNPLTSHMNDPINDGGDDQLKAVKGMTLLFGDGKIRNESAARALEGNLQRQLAGEFDLSWLDESLRPMAKAFIDITDAKPMKSEQSHWRKVLLEFQQAGYGVSDVARASRIARNADLSIKSPSSVRYALDEQEEKDNDQTQAVEDVIASRRQILNS